MQINYSYYTWMIIVIFLVIAIACYAYDKGIYANSDDKPTKV